MLRAFNGPDAMTSSLRLALALAAMTATTACNRDAAPTASAPAASAAPATPAAAPTVAAPPTDAGSQSMTMEQVDRYLAAAKALDAAAKTDASLEDVGSVNVSEENSQAQHVARIEANPKAVALLAQAGTTPAEYARMTQLLPAAFFAYGMLESGQIKTVPEGIDPALIEFMKAHGTEIAAKMKAAGQI
jgi:hypothetical protein